MEKKIYEFTNDGNSCVIYDAKPPRYWFNYLWNENGYCAQVSQNGHGRSYYLNERADESNLMREKERLSARQNGAAALFAGNETTKERCILWKIYSISLTVTL